eukprot:Amastigsp_a508820_192.p1 type:complete len:229 gc:universal Amastigsp_a508820_192:730-44(-)
MAADDAAWNIGPFVYRWPRSLEIRRGRSLDMWFFRAPSATDCARCKRSVPCGDAIFGNCYHNDEVGYFLCGSCWEAATTPAHPIDEDEERVVDMRRVTVASSENLVDAEAILLAPNSDNGFPSAHARAPGPVTVVLDLGKVCEFAFVGVHNWYWGGYPSSVIVEVAAAVDASEWFRVSGASPAPLTKASIWHNIACETKPCRAVKLTFPQTLEAAIKTIKLGVVQLWL